jgi:hypothetical protein
MGWLLRDPDVRAAAERAEVSGCCGGPILTVQVENEYGSFGADHGYMEAIRGIIRKAGSDVHLYAADASSEKRLNGGRCRTCRWQSI